MFRFTLKIIMKNTQRFSWCQHETAAELKIGMNMTQFRSLINKDFFFLTDYCFLVIQSNLLEGSKMKTCLYLVLFNLLTEYDNLYKVSVIWGRDKERECENKISINASLYLISSKSLLMLSLVLHKIHFQ